MRRTSNTPPMGRIPPGPTRMQQQIQFMTKFSLEHMLAKQNVGVVYLKRFCNAVQEEPSLLFLLSADKFQATTLLQRTAPPPEALRKDADDIFQRFLGPKAVPNERVKLSVVPLSVRNAVGVALTSAPTAGDLVQAFQPAQRLAMRYLQRVVYPQFLQSRMFIEYRAVMLGPESYTGEAANTNGVLPLSLGRGPLISPTASAVTLAFCDTGIDNLLKKQNVGIIYLKRFCQEKNDEVPLTFWLAVETHRNDCLTVLRDTAEKDRMKVLFARCRELFGKFFSDGMTTHPEEAKLSLSCVSEPIRDEIEGQLLGARSADALVTLFDAAQAAAYDYLQTVIHFAMKLRDNFLALAVLMHW
eukprot:TRINITY_DN12589_c0_g1_i1.p1 TRINITY_DN12589_c0_g1~~TRINITY_DN12589_c0_g1_i1.p1  ORF type:complete len:357 (-),score=72.50 TRINITY_DN12589_c0_g1_i1:329-1399(-)